MEKRVKSVWRLLAAVKLALAVLFILAGASVIGTVIKQGQSPAYYIEAYGPAMARIFQLLGIPDLYSSWWFVALLCLFALNLVVCSIERLPGAWNQVVQSNLTIAPERLEKMTCSHRLKTAMPTEAAADRVQQLLSRSGWKKAGRLDRDGSTLLFAQRGAWSRFGVHLVHLSVLVILAGALLGTWFGFKAYVILPEGRSTTLVYLQKDKAPVPLGFELYYDRFETAHYPNGMVREYRSDLTVYDTERETPLRKTSIVNDPLQYRGVAFYIADNYPLEEYLVVVRNLATGLEQAFRIPPGRQVAWAESDVVFSLEEVQRTPEGAARQARIKFSAGTDQSSVFWMPDKGTANLKLQGQAFSFSFRQLYSTLFLSTRDPGVWFVWIGSALMVIGFWVSFFLSHQKIWVHITASGKQGSRILVGGAGNKHPPAFERRFQALVARLEENGPVPSPSLPQAGLRRTAGKPV